uniref:Uncharacterized protein n=1 Tax=Lactuca sativa TaxID=4236 RepID=A0A9R1X8P7_LACSA|nr:hypothetical protein LSAT_V11C500248500 [Lactuca sativa]
MKITNARDQGYRVTPTHFLTIIYTMFNPKSTDSKDPPYTFWCFQDCVVRLSVILYIDLYSVVSLVESDRYQLGVHSISRVGFVGLSEAPVSYAWKVADNEKRAIPDLVLRV